MSYSHEKLSFYLSESLFQIYLIWKNVIYHLNFIQIFSSDIFFFQFMIYLTLTKNVICSSFLCKEIFCVPEFFFQTKSIIISPRKTPNELFPYEGASINYVDKEGGRKCSIKCQRYYISLFSKLANKGGGGSKYPKFSHVAL